MNRITWLGGLSLSVMIHVAAAASIIALSTVDWNRPLFVDLTAGADGPAAPGASETARARSSPARPTPRVADMGTGARPAAVAPSRPAQPIAAPASPPSAPAAPLDVPLLPPIPLAPAVPEPRAPAHVPEPAGPSALPATSSAASLGPSGPAETAAAPRPSGETRADAGAGGGTSPLALAMPGSGSIAVAAEYGPYLQRFRRLVQEALVYPLAARRQGLGGTVELDVLLEANGRVRDVKVVRSSSHGMLDDAAIETIRRLGPMPFPESLPRRALLIRLPLVFELR